MKRVNILCEKNIGLLNSRKILMKNLMKAIVENIFFIQETAI